jgi:hypothetical protein
MQKIIKMPIIAIHHPAPFNNHAQIRELHVDGFIGVIYARIAKLAKNIIPYD